MIALKLSLFAVTLLVLPMSGQMIPRARLATILGFENGVAGSHPTGWGGMIGDSKADDQIFHTGKLSARIERNEKSSGAFTTITAAIEQDFTGNRVDWCGWIKAESVCGFVALWLRQDDSQGSIGFDTLQSLKLRGTFDWTRYCVKVPVRKGGKNLFFGFLLGGTGKAWVDTTELTVDGKPAAEAPELPREVTVLDTDKEFEKGSGLVLPGLSEKQVANIALAGKVWGFLKYHHPQVTAGKKHWDYELFRMLPKLIAADDIRPVLTEWIDSLGTLGKCQPCAALNQDKLHIKPDLGWLSDQVLLGKVLSEKLLAVHRGRSSNTQFYVSIFPGIGNPKFEHELTYAEIQFPDPGYQLLSLFRFWNMMQYFNPNRELMADNPAIKDSYWHQVLTESIRPFAMAKSRVEYDQQLLQLIAKVKDGHSNLWSSLRSRPPIGTCQIPVAIRFIEDKPVVMTANSIATDHEFPLKRGDVITKLDGIPVEKLIDGWRPFYAASNEPTRKRDIANSMTNGTCGVAKIEILRSGKAFEYQINRVSKNELNPQAGIEHHLPGPTFQKLSEDVAYLKLRPVSATEAPNYIRSAEGTKGLIIDIRNYPAEFMVFSLGGHLVRSPTSFVQFTNMDLANPGAFHWMTGPKIQPKEPHYPGKVVILVDESTQSSAEYTTMAFRAAPNAIVMGSTTAGADGNVSQISLPGAASSMISGIGIYFPDNRPTQRIGIVPDIVVKPTIAGIKANKDEVLDAAIEYIRRPDGGARR
jgi:C-terminal processing protease CtpA/Prc